MSILDREINARFDRSRYASALSYVDETNNGVKRAEVEFVVTNDPGGAGVVTTYDLKRPETTAHLVSSAGARLEGWSISEKTGPASSDQIVFDSLQVPTHGSTVRVVYDYNGIPLGEFFGKREYVEVDEESEFSTFRTTGDEKLWHIAGRRDTYDDPSFWWVIVDANPGLNGIFQAMLSPIPRDVDLVIPAEAEVLLQIEGLYEL